MSILLEHMPQKKVGNKGQKIGSNIALLIFIQYLALLKNMILNHI